MIQNETHKRQPIGEDDAPATGPAASGVCTTSPNKSPEVGLVATPLPWWHPSNLDGIPQPYKSLGWPILYEIKDYELLPGWSAGPGLPLPSLGFPSAMERLRVKLYHVMMATGLEAEDAVAQVGGYTPMAAVTMRAIRRLLDMQSMTYGCLWQVCLEEHLDPRGLGFLATPWLEVPFAASLGQIGGAEWQEHLRAHKRRLDETARTEAAAYLRPQWERHSKRPQPRQASYAAWSPTTEWTPQASARSWWIIGQCLVDHLYVAPDALLENIDHWLIPLPELAMLSGVPDLQVFRQVTGRSHLTRRVHAAAQRLVELHQTELEVAWEPHGLADSELAHLLPGTLAGYDEYEGSLGDMTDEDWESEVSCWIDSFGHEIDFDHYNSAWWCD